ncbi:MAG TPA: Lrp/AsnC family transcriptional regulator [Bryobacteraceae bacterium]|jgi:DNA-binding Lrp family transcriptional regulator|nr:Lrp/AsnC family transcriptional regulator [Bryobacteraceae bacterium]
MDSKDRGIINALMRNGRISNQDLAEQVHLSPSPCLRRVRQLEESGIIRGYTAIVDEEAVGLPVTAFIRVRLQVHEKAQFTAFEKAVSKIDAVVDCYLIAGGTDYLLRVIVGSLKEYEALMTEKIHAIPGISTVDTSFALSRTKRSTILPLKDEL